MLKPKASFYGQYFPLLVKLIGITTLLLALAMIALSLVHWKATWPWVLSYCFYLLFSSLSFIASLLFLTQRKSIAWAPIATFWYSLFFHYAYTAYAYYNFHLLMAEDAEELLGLINVFDVNPIQEVQGNLLLACLCLLVISSLHSAPFASAYGVQRRHIWLALLAAVLLGLGNIILAKGI